MKHLAILTVAAGLLACRPDAGIPDYSGHVGLRDTTDYAEESLPGPKPYDPGVPRLYLGAFYEGDRSHEILVNDFETHYYVFTIDGTGELTYSQETSAERVEGLLSDAIMLEGTPWWGGGLIYDVSWDLSEWTTMSISLRSTAASFEDIEISVQSEPEGALQTHTVLASTYGYSNDGQWHSLRIPLEDFAGFDSATTRSPLILGRGVSGNVGETLLVDDFYYE